MLEILHDILKNSPGTIELTFLSWWHLLYILLDLPLIATLCFFNVNKPTKSQDKWLWGIAIFALASYVLDLALQPIIYLGEATVWETIINKTPFHLSTLSSILILLAMIIKKDWFRNIVAMYAMFSGILFLIAPQTYVQGGYSPFCYQVLQTFLYHGAILLWALYAVLSGFVKPSLKYLPSSLASFPLIGLWAEIGNTLFYTPTRNFMFMRHDILGLLPGNWYFLEYAIIGLVVISGYYAFFGLVYPRFAQKLNLAK